MFATVIDPAATYCVTSSTTLLNGHQRVRRGAPVLGADLPRARGAGHHAAAKLFQQRVEETTHASGAAAYRALVRLLLAETGRCSTPSMSSMFGFADDLFALDGVE